MPKNWHDSDEASITPFPQFPSSRPERPQARRAVTQQFHDQRGKGFRCPLWVDFVEKGRLKP
jgi:hypothetical protein